MSSSNSSSMSSSESAEAEAVITSPLPNAVVTSPLKITGKARGSWFFEASLPVSLEDDKGHVFATLPAHTDEEWMTTDFVNFSIDAEFISPKTKGFIVVSKDNPSGDPERDASIRIPIIFK